MPKDISTYEKPGMEPTPINSHYLSFEESSLGIDLGDIHLVKVIAATFPPLMELVSLVNNGVTVHAKMHVFGESILLDWPPFLYIISTDPVPSDCCYSKMFPIYHYGIN
jgi:hypothetical protein